MGYECEVETSNIGTPKVVGVEDAFTGQGTDPTHDPTGLTLLLSLIDGAYWPLQVCGDTGVGAPFSENPIGVNKGGNVLTTYKKFGDPITAHGCLMNCDYRITISLAAEVIIAEIDGKYNIIRVRHTSSTVPTLSSSNDCRCCGLTPQRMTLYYRIIDGCTYDGECDEYVINPGDICLPSAENPLSVQVGCHSEAGSELEDKDDWSVHMCDVQAEITGLTCFAPPIDECSDPYEDSYGERLEIYANAICGYCRYSIFIYSKPNAPDPCALEDVPIEIVEMEACGLPDLRPGNRVIVAEVPVEYNDPYQFEDPYEICKPVRYFLIRACSSKDCADPCEPPPPPTTCCGILCNDLPSTLFLTIEILDCDCACTPPPLILTKQPCEPGIEKGEWRFEVSPDMRLCDLTSFYFEFRNAFLRCGEEYTVDGYVLGGFSLESNGQTGVLVSGSCEAGAFFFVFEFANLPVCKEKFPGMIFPIDLSCRARMTVTQ